MKDKKNKKLKEKGIAIEVKNISKTFVIPHEKTNSVRGAFVNLFKSKNYEKFKALNNISFQVKKGEFFGILGRNGSGKSTLLKTLAGIYQPDSGEIKVNGLISPFLELGIGFNPDLSGRDNVYLNASVLGMTKKEIDEKFDSIVKFAELEKFIDQRLKKYSSGMQVRLAFAVSIHANRDILLMDEVLAVGDTNFQSKCLAEFSRYRDLGRTVVIVTHDTSVVERYCDRAMLLRNGNVVEIGKASEVANRYIQNNISDENERMALEKMEKKKKEDVEKNKKVNEIKINKIEALEKIEKKEIKKVAEILDVKFFDKNGKEKSVFKTNSFVKVRIYYKINSFLEELNVGLSITDENGNYLFGYNTDMDNFNLNKNVGFVDIVFEKLPFLKGNYYINPSLFKRSGLVAFDFLPKFKELKIFSSNKENLYKGSFLVKHFWNQ